MARAKRRSHVIDPLFLAAALKSTLAAVSLGALIFLQASTTTAISPEQRRAKPLFEVFAPVIDDTTSSTVRILADGARVAYGVVVTEDGHVVTKASVLRGEMQVIHAGQTFGAELVDLSIDHDLALLTVKTDDAEVIWTPVVGVETEPRVGQWVVSSGLGERPLAIGICSVQTRSVDSGLSSSPALLGVRTADSSAGLRVETTVASSAARAAGVRAGDMLLSAGGIDLETRADLLRVLESKIPGDALPLVVSRRGEQVELTAKLTTWPTGMRRGSESRMSGPLSARRSNFPAVLQHDGPLRPSQCGSAVVDVQGRVVGLNIARSERVSTLALPWRVVQEFTDDVLAATQED